MSNKVKDKKQINDFDDFEDRVKAHRSVLKSLIDKDGWFKTNEAVEINNGFGKQLAVLKLRLESYKLMREIPDREELFLHGKTKKNT